MILIFLGNQEDLERATIGSRVTGSLFLIPSLRIGTYIEALAGADGLIVPVRALSAEMQALGDTRWPIPVIASGTGLDCEEAMAYACDDFIREPWDSPELHTRFKRIIQKRALHTSSVPSLQGDRICFGDRELTLTRTEATALRFLIGNAGQQISRSTLLRILGFAATSRALDMCVSRLRKKLALLHPALARSLVRGSSTCYSFIP